LEQLFAKKNNEKVKPPLETRDVPSFLGAHMSSPHMVRVLELLYKTKEISEFSFVLEIASFFQPPKSGMHRTPERAYLALARTMVMSPV